MKIYLCDPKGCCPSVDIRDNEVLIGEDDNMCILTREQFDVLKEKIRNNEL